jgi:hypothetical protein
MKEYDVKESVSGIFKYYLGATACGSIVAGAWLLINLSWSLHFISLCSFRELFKNNTIIKKDARLQYYRV